MNSLSYCAKLQDFHLNGIRDIAYSYGVSLDELCLSLGYKLDRQLNFRDLDKIVAFLCETIQRPWAALEFVRKMTFHQIGTIGPLVASCNTFKSAMNLIATYQPLLHPGFVVKIDKNNSGQTVMQIQSHDRSDLPSWLTEAFFSGLIYWGQLVVDQTITVDSVWFHHPRPDYADKYHDVFECENIQFEKEYDAVFLSESSLNLKMKTASLHFHLEIKKEADRLLQDMQSFSSIVKGIIRSHLPNDCSIDDIAESLNCSIRTFQRKLDEDGSNLRQLKQDVKLEEAVKLLEKSHFSLEKIAYQLGYSKRTSFCSAFEKWTGISPAEWRIRKLRNS